jgi:hypothetical protein
MSKLYKYTISIRPELCEKIRGWKIKREIKSFNVAVNYLLNRAIELIEKMEKKEGK